ncbi:Nitrate reductase delta subunit [Desulfitobacterium hafniense]|uniref:Nitrate reductase delta subunit n=2 Tax=Desulfitobacterium hafniense TaxID=49338 RepID=A0A098B5R0_DESHA|nr:Nitrate reductase delta subunit [Desulfitobacterium hafniense]
MNIMEHREKLASRLESYNFFSYIFMTLPNTEFVDKILRLMTDGELQSKMRLDLIESYIKSCAVKTLPTVLQEILVDRTQLLRGINEDGCPPPYESLYVKRPPQDVMGEITSLYNKANCTLAEDVHDSREYIGVELNFMVMLCMKQWIALESNDANTAKNMSDLQIQFFNEHLSRWIPHYARRMYEYAQTDFYKGIALLLENWIEEESIYLSEQLNIQ